MASSTRRRLEPALRFLPLIAGAAAIVVGTLLGWSSAIHDLVVSPPPFVRVTLGSASVLVGAVFVSRAAQRLAASREPADLMRGVRWVFLAVAAFAAAGGWFVGSVLPFIAALVIAGVDVLETSVFLLVTSVRGDGRVEQESDPAPE